MQPTSQQTAHPTFLPGPWGEPRPHQGRKGPGHPTLPKLEKWGISQALSSCRSQVCLRLSLGRQRQWFPEERRRTLGPRDWTGPRGWVRTGKVATARACAPSLGAEPLPRKRRDGQGSRGPAFRLWSPRPGRLPGPPARGPVLPRTRTIG